eukprot:Em0673g1a
MKNCPRVECRRVSISIGAIYKAAYGILSRRDYPHHHPPLPSFTILITLVTSSIPSSPSSITLITILHYHHHPPLPSHHPPGPVTILHPRTSRQDRGTSRQDPQHQPPGPEHQPPDPQHQPPGPAAPAAPKHSRRTSTQRQDPQQPHDPAPAQQQPAARTAAPAARTGSRHTQQRQDPQHQPPGPPQAPAARTRSTSRQDRSTSRQDPHHSQETRTRRHDHESPSYITLITILHYPHHHPPLSSSPFFTPTLTLITTLTPTLITCAKVLVLIALKVLEGSVSSNQKCLALSKLTFLRQSIMDTVWYCVTAPQTTTKGVGGGHVDYCNARHTRGSHCDRDIGIFLEAVSGWEASAASGHAEESYCTMQQNLSNSTNRRAITKKPDGQTASILGIPRLLIATATEPVCSCLK